MSVYPVDVRIMVHESDMEPARDFVRTYLDNDRTDTIVEYELIVPLTRAEVRRYEGVKAIAEAVYGGVPGGRSEDDAAQLRRLADWLDKIDDIADAMLESAVDPEIAKYRVGRDIQIDLRRIADKIDGERG